MRKLLRLTIGMVLAVALAAGFSPTVSVEAQCGTCRDGTLDMSTSSCPPPHTDCTECDACAK